MPLEPIRRRGAQEPDRAEVEAAVIAAVEADPEPFLAAYQRHPSSFDGRYVCADLFKETFPQYAASPEARGRFNGVVHNSAAVLSSEQFRRVIADDSEPGRDTAIFLTGIPGAGKTSFVLAGGELDPATRVIFEGQLINPVTSIEKIGAAIGAGLKPVVIAVHPRPENALANTFRRFTETGRGAGIGVMADIQGGLPDGLRAIERAFGDDVQLVVIDVRDRSRPAQHTGWASLPILQTEGNRGDIHQRLSDALDSARAAGTITDDCYRQASGLPPRAQHASVDRPGPGGREGDARGRGDARPGGGPPVLAKPADDGSYTGQIVGMDATTATQLVAGKHIVHQLRHLTGSTGALAQGKAVAISYRGGIGKVADPQQQSRGRCR